MRTKNRTFFSSVDLNCAKVVNNENLIQRLRILEAFDGEIQGSECDGTTEAFNECFIFQFT